MINLSPKWADSFPAYYNEIEKKAQSLIWLRFASIFFISIISGIINSSLKLQFSSFQKHGFFAVLIVLFVTNFLWITLLQRVKTNGHEFNSLHHFLSQIVLDIVAIGIVVYFTGGIESPLLILFAVHILIASFVYPTRLLYLFVLILTAKLSLLNYFEIKGLIQHQVILGFTSVGNYQNPIYVTVTLAVFTSVLLVGVFIGNMIGGEIYKMQLNLLKSLRKIEQADKDKQKYVKGIIHELKSPFSAINSTVNLLLQKIVGPIDEKVEERLIRIKKRSEDGITSINEIIKLADARLNSELIVSRFDVVSVIYNLLENYKSVAEDKGLILTILNHSNNKLYIEGDKSKIELLFSNLIGNSIKYTSEGGAIKIEVGSQEETYFLFVINDTGIGIPETDLSKMFTDFFRASNAKQSQIEGTGLGLAVTKQIVDNHKGIIKVFSPGDMANELYKGTKFTVQLPLSKI